MSKRRDWGAIVNQTLESESESAKERFSQARSFIDAIPEKPMVSSFSDESEKVSQCETVKKQSVSSLNELAEDANGLMIPIGLLSSNPYNARVFYDKEVIDSLAQSLIVNGQKQPIVVTNDQLNPGRFIIIDGEYRYRAAQLTNWDYIRCDYYHDVNKEELYHVSSLINEQRTAQTVFDNARVWQRFLSDGTCENAKALSEFLGKDPSIVSRTLSIANIGDDIVHILIKAQSPIGVNLAYAFSKLYKDAPADLSLETAKQVADGSIGIRDIEKLHKSLSKGEAKKDKPVFNSRVFANANGKKIGLLKHDGKRLSMDLTLPEVSDELIERIGELVSSYIPN